MIHEIYLNYLERYPEWKGSAFKRGLLNDIEFLLRYNRKGGDDFYSFLIWQLELLRTLEIEEEAFFRLLQLCQEMGAINLDENFGPRLSALSHLIVNGAEKDVERVAQAFDFHVRLFSDIDPAAHVDHTAKIKSDLDFILHFLHRSRAQKEDSLFELFLNWHRHLLEAIGVKKIALVRMLVSLQVFMPTEDKEVLRRATRALVKNQFVEWNTASSKAEQIAQIHIRLFDGLDKHAALKYKEHMVNDAEKHLAFLDQAFQAQSEILFIEYTNWLKSTLGSLGIEALTIIRFMATLRMVLNPDNPSMTAMLDAGIQNLVAAQQKNQKESSSMLIPEAEKYLEILLEGDRTKASNYILDLVHKGMPVRDVYIDIFQSAQYEIGRLWEQNELSVAQEHYCTATTQMIMSLLFPQIMSASSNGNNVVATCVGSELHEMGIRMVADFLEMEGWNTYYIGANVPHEAILESISRNKAHILALSVTLTPHIKNAVQLIEAVRYKFPTLKILVGGYPFTKDPELWSRIGADATVGSVLEVHKQASRLLES
ncbi:cobalamin-dependent protein [bacterium SCSIO 12741]|nr:cobalamin-dependent protein [bacterium SCSIO 12741]